MSGIVIVIAVGVFVASLVAFAINVMVPGGDSTSTEDRLAAMASRRRGGGGGDEADEGSLLLGDLEDSSKPMAKLMKNLPALADYLEQADINLQPSKFAFICLACFAAGIGACVVTPVPMLLGPDPGIPADGSADRMVVHQA